MSGMIKVGHRYQAIRGNTFYNVKTSSLLITLSACMTYLKKFEVEYLRYEHLMTVFLNITWVYAASNNGYHV